MRHSMIGPILLAIAGLPAIGAPASASAAAPAAAAASTPMPGHPSMTPSQRNRPKAVEHYVDINSAGRKELMTLPGVGAAEADKIIAHRPYLTKTELVTKQVLATGPFMSLKHLVVAMPKSTAKARPASKP